jgi:hypothetical protein
MERVSILLGHQSVRVTEKYYAAWTESRQRQVEADLQRAWEQDPVVILETKVTRRVRCTGRSGGLEPEKVLDLRAPSKRNRGALIYQKNRLAFSLGQDPE